MIYSNWFAYFRESKALIEELRAEYRINGNYSLLATSYLIGVPIRFAVSGYFALFKR